MEVFEENSRIGNGSKMTWYRAVSS